MKKISKIIAGVAAIAAFAISIPVAINAWGDNNGSNRQMYDLVKVSNLSEKCTTQAEVTNKECTLVKTGTTEAYDDSNITFNSITNNPWLANGGGDERNFVAARDASTGNNGAANFWNADDINVTDGEEVVVRAYVHNNNPVAANATGVRAYFTGINTENMTNDMAISGMVTADNSNPTKIWDEVHLKSATPFNVSVVAGSVLYESKGASTSLNNDVFGTNGQLLGENGNMNGVIAGCFDHDGILTFRVKVQYAQPTDLLPEKFVAVHNDSENNAHIGHKEDWVTSITANPGDKVDFKVKYTNIGKVQQDNVTLYDDNMQTNGLTFNNDTKWYNLKTGAFQDAVGNITTDGINLGSYNPDAMTYATFTATVPNVCGTHDYTNTAKVATTEKNNAWSFYRETNTVTIHVEGPDCTPPVTPTCEEAGNCETTPTTIANTGAGLNIGLTVAAAAIAFGVANAMRARKVSRK